MRNSIYCSFDELDAKGSSSYVLPLSLLTVRCTICRLNEFGYLCEQAVHRYIEIDLGMDGKVTFEQTISPRKSSRHATQIIFEV